MTDEFKTALGRNLAAAAKARPGGNHRLAVDAGLQIDHIRDIVRKTEDPGVYKVYRIARALGTTIEALIGEQPLSPQGDAPGVQQGSQLINKPEDLMFFHLWDRLDADERRLIISAAVDFLRKKPA